MNDEANKLMALVDDALAQGAYETVFQIAYPWAERGNSWAETCIGSLYHTGLGVKQDLHKAVEYYERAAASDYPAALYALGVVYDVGGEGLPQDREAARSYYQRAKEMGYYPSKPSYPI